MQNIVNTIKGRVIEAAAQMTPVLKVSEILCSGFPRNSGGLPSLDPIEIFREIVIIPNLLKINMNSVHSKGIQVSGKRYVDSR